MILFLQVFDYYVSLRWNDIGTCMPHLYRLFCASVMLRGSRVNGGSLAHNYPKMILANMLIIEHWRQTGYVGHKIMERNMHMFNEELGEISFSVLSRCVLGDNNKSDFEHMQKMYKLLPVYRELKDDMLKDSATSASINFRHTIREDDDNVRVAVLFFQRTIRQILNGEYRSYNGSEESYKSQAKASQCYTVDHQPLVYTSNISVSVLAYLDQVNDSVTSHFLHNDRDLWTEAQVADDTVPVDIDEEEQVMEEDFAEHEEEDFAEEQWGDDDRLCIPGNYALCVETWQNGRGLKLVKIVRIEEPRIYPGSTTLWPNFTGKDRLCTVVQTDVQCLTGTWNHHPRRSTESNVPSYGVVVYFSNLNPRDKLPNDVVQCVHQHPKFTELFEHFGEDGPDR
jgi:hypothetical protein